MKQSYLLSIALLLPFALSAQIVNIPDPNFKAALVGNTEINTNGDEEIQYSEAEAFSGTIDVSGLGINDMTGLSAFTSLTKLWCLNNSLSSLDISSNTSLDWLDCSNNQISSLDPSANTALRGLYCSSNQLSSLDVSANATLLDLQCSSNLLVSLDVKANKMLMSLFCSSNQLNSLDLSENTNLSHLFCKDNLLINLDVRTNLRLSDLYCNGNKITSLDLRENTTLKRLDCSSNELINLDVRNGNNELLTAFNATNNSALTSICVDDVVFATTNWTNIDHGTSYNTYCGESIVYITDPNFKSYLINNSSINLNGDSEIHESEAVAFTGSIDVSQLNIFSLRGLEAFTSITKLNCSATSITSIDISKNVALASLNCSSNQLIKIDMRNGNNELLIEFDARNNPALSCISVDDVDFATDNWINFVDDEVYFNEDCGSESVNIPDPIFKSTLLAMTSINTNGDDEIQFSEAEAYAGVLYLFEFGISDMTGIEAFINLTGLECGNNSITSLDVRSNIYLSRLSCELNQISELDVSNNSLLTILECQGNLLGSLDVSANAVLRFLKCGNKDFSDLDVSNNLLLEVLSCGGNLGNLDVTLNKNLQYLSCVGCHLSSLDVSLNAALTTLVCDYNQLENLDVTSNPDLITILCSNNELSNLDVSSNLALTDLNCSSNKLTNLDLSNNIALEDLSCHDNSLINLDVSSNKVLTDLYCYSNQLTFLDLTSNPALETLSCRSNQLNSLDLSLNTALKAISCSENLLQSLDVSNNTSISTLSCHSNKLSCLDLSANINLYGLDCSSNQLSNLDLRNGNNNIIRGFDAHNNPLLSCINVDDVDYATANWTDIDDGVMFSEDCGAEVVYIPDPNFKAALVANTEINTNGDEEIQYSEAEAFSGTINVANLGLTEMTGLESFTSVTMLSCANNLISELNISNNLMLSWLECNSNHLSELDVSKNTRLSALNCATNSLNNLNLSENKELTWLNCSSNQLTSLEINTSTKLNYLFCSNNQINDLDLSMNKELLLLQCSSNPLNNVDVSSNTLLQELSCHSCNMNSLDVKSNTALTDLDCSSNSIRDLDLSANNLLSKLHCNSNLLGELDLSGNKMLTELRCWSNPLSSLDVNANTQLKELFCSDTDLSNLDVSANESLEILHCSDNQINRLDLRNNIALNYLFCSSNELISLDMRNGNNTIIQYFVSTNNPELSCISVDDVDYATTNWINIDPGVIFSTDGCNVYIPDPNFKTALVANAAINTNGDDEIQYSEAEAFTGSIFVDGLGIIDMTGIEAFTSLDGLYCYNNMIENLDLSYNTALANLNCYANSLSNLNVSKNTALIELICTGNQLSNLDLSNNDLLQILVCSANSLTTLDVSNNTALEILACEQNKLSTLNVIQNTALTLLACNDNILNDLDISANPSLNWLAFSNNLIDEIDISNNLLIETFLSDNNLLENIDLRNHTSLAQLNCSYNTKLNTLDIRNGNNGNIHFFSASNNPNLSCISVSDVDFAISNWTDIDEGVSFDLDCGFLVDFRADEVAGYSPLTVQFSDETTGASISWSWHFDDDGVEDSDEQNPTFEYSAPGTYTVSLEVNNGRISKSEYKSSYITVKQPVVASFSADIRSGTASLDIQFSDESQGAITSWQWDFGDGNTSSDESPLHTYETEGVYTISLTVSDGTMSDTKTMTDYIEVLFNPKQTITFNALPAVTYGDPSFNLDAVTTSGLPVNYSSSNTAVATISGEEVTIIGAGSTIITATQPGDDVYNAAEPVEQELIVEKADQGITFAALDSRSYGDQDFDLGATSTSGLSISYSSSDIEVATISGSKVTIVGVGTTMITASNAGDNNYNAAEDVSVEFIVNKADQSITFAALDSHTYGDQDFDLGATTTSGLTISYSSSDSEVATISEGTVTIVGAGSAMITASQEGDDNYNEAEDVSVELMVNKAAQSITFPEIPDRFLKDSPLTLDATSTSELDVTYEIIQGPATIDGNLMTFNKLGEVTVEATQNGDRNYLSAVPVSRTFNIIAITGLDEMMSAGISCYPNPASNTITIESDQNIESIRIVNINGQTLFEKAMIDEFDGKLEIDVLNYQAGEYIIQISNPDLTISEKVFIVK